MTNQEIMDKNLLINKSNFELLTEQASQMKSTLAFALDAAEKFYRNCIDIKSDGERKPMSTN